MTEAQEVAEAIWNNMARLPMANREQCAQLIWMKLKDESYEVRQAVTDDLWHVHRQTRV